MPPLYRIAEVAVYSLLNFLPFLVLALYPFRHSLRFSRRVTGLLILLLTCFQLALGEQNHQLAMQTMPYGNLQEKIAEARRAKHDVRHHITLMQEYLNEGNYAALRDYLNRYGKSLPDDSPLCYCENPAANAVLLYFAQQAKESGIEYTVRPIFRGSFPYRIPIFPFCWGTCRKTRWRRAKRSTPKAGGSSFAPIPTGTPCASPWITPAPQRPDAPPAASCFPPNTAGAGLAPSR